MYSYLYVEYGTVCLPYGSHDLFVATANRHDSVYLRIDEDEHQVCGADTSKATAIVEDLGFRLLADIGSNEATVVWAAPLGRDIG